jgi:glutathione S-transferase
MILVGMFDSPFVRRVAVTLNRLGIPFEHRDWSVGRDFDLIRGFNPLGRVPTLVLDDGEALLESSAILDHLDELAGPARALLPPAGARRRAALRLMGMASGAAEKGVQQLYEAAFRPAAKRHQPWMDRCDAQMHGALFEWERAAADRGGGWLVGEHLTQADVTAACVYTFLNEALGVGRGERAYPALSALAARCEALPEFLASRAAFAAPSTNAAT